MSLWYLDYNGDAWEGICNVLLGTKYGTDYQPIGDKGGDLGLDGLNLRAGTAYQAYGQEPENKDPVSGVRKKIGTDLKKLQLNESEIAAIIGSKKIRNWALLLNKEIPHNGLHRYAKQKETEVKSWGLSIIDPDFQVSIQTPSFLETEWLEYQKRRDDRIEVTVEDQPVPALVVLRQNENFKLVYEKFRVITDNDEEAEQLAYFELKNFLENSIQLSEIQRREPDFFSQIEEIRSDIENDAEQGSIAVGSWDSFSHVKTTLESRLNAVVGNRLGAKTLSRIRKYTIADWLVRCPLRFKRKRSLQ